jgi:hypothetical protein
MGHASQGLPMGQHLVTNCNTLVDWDGLQLNQQLDIPVGLLRWPNRQLVGPERFVFVGDRSIHHTVRGLQPRDLPRRCRAAAAAACRRPPGLRDPLL